MSTRKPPISDPYKQWLDIPEGERPPNHYRLLGVELFEADTARIREAADRRYSQIKPRGLSHREVATQLLDEIAKARVCLTDPNRKATYDRALRIAIAQSPQEPPESRRRSVILEGHTDAVAAVAFHPNGSLLASGSHDGTVRLWRLPEGTLEATLATSESPLPGKRKTPFGAYVNPVGCIAYSPEGSLLAVAGRDMAVRLSDGLTGELRRTFAPSSAATRVSPITSLAFTPDGALLATGSSRSTVKLWSTATGQLARRMADPTESLAVSPDGRMLVSTGGFWDVASGDLRHTFQGDTTFQGNTGRLRCLAFGPEGTHVASGSDDGGVRLWDAHTGNLTAKLAKHDGPVASVAFSAEGARPARALLASCSADGTIEVWHTTHGRSLATLLGHTGSVNDVQFGPTGTMLASAGVDRTVRLWDIAPLLGNL